MKLVNTGFKDLLIIENTMFSDNRGEFTEIFKKKLIEKKIGYKLDFCQSNHVESNYMSLRGLHYQEHPFEQSKLISVNSGKIMDIAVDIRKDSETYGKYFSFVLSGDNRKALFIPKGFAHGYLTISDKASVNYLVDNYYNKNAERGISYKDKFLKIDWGVDFSKILISKKDMDFSDYKWIKK